MEKSPFIALSLFILCTLGALLYFSGLGEFAANLFVSTITALATATAAWMAAESARAARQAADQWKEQKHYERELDAIIEVLTTFSEWRNNLIQHRQGIGALIAERLSSKSQLAGVRYSYITDLDISGALQKHLEVSNRLRNAVDKARTLGIYEQEAVVDVYRLDYQFTQALQRFRQIQLTDEITTVQDRKHLSVIFDKPQFDEYGNALNGSWMNFELRYQQHLKVKGK